MLVDVETYVEKLTYCDRKSSPTGAKLKKPVTGFRPSRLQHVMELPLLRRLQVTISGSVSEVASNTILIIGE
jgi:hypothetical protein